ncbi:MAG: leucine-rich repeat protein [Solobacterium sp.]|nr:leucine-rich repeat protein [Solobacterium sp.]
MSGKRKTIVAALLCILMCFSNSFSIRAEDETPDTQEETLIEEIQETETTEEITEELISEENTEEIAEEVISQEESAAEENIPDDDPAVSETEDDFSEDFEYPKEETDIDQEVIEETIAPISEETEESELMDTEGDYTYSINNEAAVITKYTGTETAVTIPSMLGGYTVTEIGQNAFQNSTVVSVVLPESVKSLSKYAFQNCKSLKSVTLPDGLDSIGQYAFQYCSSLSEINVPSSLKSIYDYAFSNCSSLPAFTLPDGIDYIGTSAFNSCNKLTYFFIPKSLRVVGSGAFRPAETIEFEEGITEIIPNACQSASKLVTVIIPETVTKIGNNAFNNCSSLQTIELPDAVTEIGHSVFKDCQKLTSVQLPEGLTSLPDQMFMYCYALTEIEIPDSVTKIGVNVFSYCKVLSNVHLPPALTSIGGGAFASCNNISSMTIPASVTEIGSGAFNACEEIIFEEGITKIPDSSFYRAYKLVRVVLPESVTEIGKSAFLECPLLKEINLSERIATYGWSSFGLCPSLEELTVGSNARIGHTAFEKCTGLKKVTIGDHVTVEGGAFAYCSGVREISIGEDLILEDYAFTDFVIKGTLDNGIAYELDAENGRLSISGEGVIPDSSEEDGSPWIKLYELISAVEIGEGITAVGNYAFSNAKDIYYALLPESLTEIGESAFTDCDNLTYIEIPGNVNRIESQAFADCDSLANIVFCGNAPFMGDEAFRLSPDVLEKILAPSTSTGWSQSFVTRNGIPLPIFYDDTMDEIGVMLLLDISDSMIDKMDTMKEAVNKFIDGIGGRINKANIAVMAYDNSTQLVSEYTTDIAKLHYMVNRIKMGAGTQYSTALNNSSNYIRNNSRNTNNYIVMFSDGEPKDNVNTIYSIADSIRTSITMFTVLVNESLLKGDVLRYIAGDENRFYWVERIENLINAFVFLQDDLRRSENTQYRINRANVNYDLLEQEFNFQKNSMELVTITVNPAIGYGDYGEVALVQNYEQVLSDEKGKFTLISPGRLFQPDTPIYAVIYDKNLNVLEEQELPIQIKETFTVNYMMNDGSGTVYTVREAKTGQPFDPPEEPSRSGYKFRGWYVSPKCEGVPYFSDKNSLNRNMLSNNLYLYAKWSKFSMGTDTFSFMNSTDYFGNSAGINIKYEIKDGDWKKLLSTASKNEKTFINKDKKWEGSCFGMSSAAVLAFNGDIDISAFKDQVFAGEIWENTINAKLTNNLLGSEDVGNIESMINFYQLRQKIGKINQIRTKGDYSAESENLKQIVEKMQTTNGPCVIGIYISGTDVSGKSYSGYHAVVGYNFEPIGAGQYKFQVYDCNISPYIGLTVTITKDSRGVYTAECAEWKQIWNASKLKFRYAMNANDLKKYRILIAPNTLSTKQSESAENDTEYYLETGYSSFTLTDGTHTAVIRNGEIYTSDFESIGVYGQSNDIYDPVTYAFGLPVLDTGYYRISVEESDSEVSTVLFYGHETEGFYTGVQTSGNGTITFDSDGSVHTALNGNTEQKLIISSNRMTEIWNSAEISSGTGNLSASYTSGEIRFVSEEDAEADIIVNADISSKAFENVSLTAGEPIRIIEENGDICRVLSGDTAINEEAFGYSVIFDSHLGTSIPTQKNVRKNSFVIRPKDPERKGYFFEGWFKDDECTEVWDFETDTVQEDTVLYAGWSLDPNYFVTVTFKLPGRTEQSMTVPNGYVLGDENCPAGISAWYTDSSCTRAWNPGSTVKGNLVLYTEDWNGIPAESVTLSSESISLKTNQSSQLNASILPEDASSYLMWQSSDEGVAKVDANGIVTAVAEGTAMITVTTGSGLSAVCEVTVTKDSSGQPDETDPDPEEGLYIRSVDSSYSYTSTAIKPVPAVYDSGKLLTAGKDYTVTYKNNTNAYKFEGERDSYVPAKGDKTPYILITGKGNYSGKTYVPFSITQIDLNDPDRVYVEESITLKTNGKVQRPVPVITFNGKVLSSKEYTLSYLDSDGVELDKKTGPKTAGTYKIVLTGNGKNFTGEKEIPLTIAEETAKARTIALSKAVTVTTATAEYDGTAKETASFANKAGYELTEGTDYTAVYTKNVNAGTATVTATGKGIYTGTVKKTFKITPRLYEEHKDEFRFEVNDTVYSKGGAIPEVHVFWNDKELKPGTDYTLKYANNKKVTDEFVSKWPTVTITFKGNFKGSVTKDFFIDPKPLDQVTITAKDKVYSAKANAWKSAPVLKDTDGKTLKAGTDYEKTITYTTKEGEELPAVVETGTVIKVTVTGKRNYTGTVSTTYRILETGRDISKATFKIADQEYTGSEILITDMSQFTETNGSKNAYITVNKQKEYLVLGENFEVVPGSYVKNINKGTAKVTFRGINGYGGTKTVSFKIGQRSIQEYWKGLFSFFGSML